MTHILPYILFIIKHSQISDILFFNTPKHTEKSPSIPVTQAGNGTN